MSLVKNVYISKLCLRNCGLVFPIVRNAGHWYKDYKPGQFPKTPEERCAAAKKYELLPHEYEPYPDDGAGIGDYPNLPLETVSADARDPFYPWDNPEFKRNFNEPLHVDATMYTADRCDVSSRNRFSQKVMYLQTLIVVASFAGLYYLGFQYKPGHAITEKQYPTPGVKHYTFDVQ